MKRDVIAIGMSDVHLSSKPPIARSGEKSWFEAMARPLKEVNTMANDLKVPVIIAGDIFHKWNSSPELINFAMHYLPRYGTELWCIPGQHDLPFHRYADMRKSAYGVLVKAKVIRSLLPGALNVLGTRQLIRVFAFPWSFEVTPCDTNRDFEEPTLAVVHEYCWKPGHSYPGADQKGNVALKNIGGLRARLKGYDAALFGDNHIGFTAQAGQCNVLNHGGFMRRNSDEVDRRPAVGLLMADMSWELHRLDCSKDVIDGGAETKIFESEELDAQKFLQQLKTLGHSGLDFKEALDAYLKTNTVSDLAKTILAEAME